MIFLEEIRSSLFSENTDIAKEVEKKLTNGETFDARLSRIKNEFETNFKDIVEKQYTQVNQCKLNQKSVFRNN